ncbi:hypothetical protein HWV62_45603 [Athelia sp. TMB]|nr:hypothetical protein HWV62_45603 [Athelia sp. TMB]
MRTKLLPNLYVEVYVGQTLVTRTIVVERSLRPIWAETLTIPSAQTSSKLTFKLKHKSAVSTDSCFGTIEETVGHMLQLCEGQKVPQLKLEHGRKKAWSNAEGFLSIHIEEATSAQARESNALAALNALERLQPTNSGAGREVELSAHDALADPAPASSSAASAGSTKEACYNPEVKAAASATPGDPEPYEPTDINDPRESGALPAVLEPLKPTKSDHAEETFPRVLKSGETPRRHHADHIASELAISPKLETLGANITQNSDILASLGSVLDKIQRIADVTVGVVDALAKAYKQQKETDAAVIGLFNKMEELYSFVGDIESLPDKIRQLGRTLVRVLEQTTECGIFFREYTDRGFAARLVGQAVNNRGKTISDLSSSLDQLRDDLKSGLQLHTAFVSSQTRDGVDRLVKSDILKGLDPAKMNAADRPVCLPGTRQDLLKTILDWFMTPSNENILWLHGAAGLGKSTLATTIAEYFRGLQRRGAFLFFDRNSPIESAPSRVISTLAYQIAVHNGSVRAAISAAIDRDPQVVSAPLGTQFVSLLAEPLAAASPQIEGPIIIILDALDECGDVSSRRTLLNLLSSPEFSNLPRQFRFLITSRPEPDIEDTLESCEHVHAVDLSMASPADLRLYIKSELQHIYSKRHIKAGLDAGWPGEIVIDKLVAFAAGLFIWAATAMKYLYIGNPAQRLENLAQAREAFSLHDLYRTALLSVWDSEMAVACNQILGLIIVSQVPLTVEPMAHLLEFTDSGTTCRLALQRLGCVIQGSEGQPVRMLHKSFPDYLTDRSACGSEPWFINIQEHQCALTRACLRIMNAQLHFNMCNLESSHIPNTSIKDLSERVEAALPLSLSYPCRFWGHHLSHVPSTDSSVPPLILQFFQSKFLYWLEVLSLMGEVQVASQILLVVKNFIPNDHTGLQAFAQDALKFVRVFAPAITYSMPHIYVSCVPLAPPLSLIKKQYIPSLNHTLVISGNVEYGWPALQQMYTGHATAVRSAAFSPDGRRIASGSDDGSVHIWDAETGLLVAAPIHGHAVAVYSIVFSLGGHRMASGSSDGTVCIWDAEKGVLVAGPFIGHTGTVYSVAFSPDGRRLASGSADRTVRIWDVENVVLATGPFEGHTDWVRSVAFSPDGRRVVSGSDDGTALIWDVEAARHAAVSEHADYVLSVVFSPDGRRVASGLLDKTVRIWDAETGTLTAGPFKGHTGPVTSVAYSPDGLRVASGSDDQIICIWDLQAGTITQTFKGHTGCIKSITFSSDGRRIASASEDGTVRIWDAEAGSLVANTSKPSTGHIGNINSVVFSPDGRHIASGSDDCTMCIWDTETGKLTGGPYGGNTEVVWSIVFSPDGRRVATGSADHSIRIWDIEMGTHVTCTGHTHSVPSVAFSPDGRRVASGSLDQTICIWDPVTGLLTAGPIEGHTDWVRSVVFSPDGRHIASGSNDATVRIWTVGSSVLDARKFEGHTDWVYSVAFSPDGRKIASGSDDQTVRIWDTETGSHVMIEGHTDCVCSVAFSADGRHVASGSSDQTVRFWDVATGTLVAGPFREHGTAVPSVAFSPDGRRFASSVSSAICVFDVSSLHLVRRQGAILGSYSQEQEEDGGKVSEGFTMASQLRENGWMVNSAGGLLFYVPPDLRAGLCWPHETAVINVKQMTRLDINRFVHGEDWVRCHIVT